MGGGALTRARRKHNSGERKEQRGVKGGAGYLRPLPLFYVGSDNKGGLLGGGEVSDAQLHRRGRGGDLKDVIYLGLIAC